MTCTQEQPSRLLPCSPLPPEDSASLLLLGSSLVFSPSRASLSIQHISLLLDCVEDSCHRYPNVYIGLQHLLVGVP